MISSSNSSASQSVQLEWWWGQFESLRQNRTPCYGPWTDLWECDERIAFIIINNNNNSANSITINIMNNNNIINILTGSVAMLLATQVAILST